MWARLDDALLDHPKISIAGAALGRNGRAVALGFYTVGLLWTQKHLTDGFLPQTVVAAFPHVDHPLRVAEVFVDARLWDAVPSKLNGHVAGFQIHDFHDFNPLAAEVRAKRDHIKTVRTAAGKHGARMRWHKV